MRLLPENNDTSRYFHRDDGRVFTITITISVIVIFLVFIFSASTILTKLATER
jgi:hypothetical protein